ncbi:MAG: hypothetical protein RTV72_06740 [Candidatus Thorarchaeota archaeon]
MSVNNDKIVYSVDDEDVEDDHSLNHCALSHVHYLVSRSQSKAKQVDRISDISNWRKHSFSVILPRKLSEHTDVDLRLMRVSLMNAISAETVHLLRIERELRERGSSLTILR